MKQEYETPKAEIEVFESEDVIMVSSISIVKDTRGTLKEIGWEDL